MQSRNWCLSDTMVEMVLQHTVEPVPQAARRIAQEMTNKDETLHPQFKYKSVALTSIRFSTLVTAPISAAAGDLSRNSTSILILLCHFMTQN